MAVLRGVLSCAQSLINTEIFRGAVSSRYADKYDN